MTELLRDTTLGKFIRLVTGKRALNYPGEGDDSSDFEMGKGGVWERYINERKTRNVRDHGTCDDLNSGKGNDDKTGEDQRQESNGRGRMSAARGSSETINGATEDIENKEDREDGQSGENKGQNLRIIDWEENDPEACD